MVPFVHTVLVELTTNSIQDQWGVAIKKQSKTHHNSILSLTSQVVLTEFDIFTTTINTKNKSNLK